MLQLRNITITTAHKTICENLSLEIGKGSSFIIHGPNGSGKTALIECLIGQREPLSGQILLDEHDLHQLRSQDRKLFLESTGIALQHSLLRPLDTVKKTLLSCTSNKEEASEMLRFLGFESIGNSLVKNLSSGEAKRLDLVRSLSNDPSLLIWDEPFSTIDASYREKFKSLVIKLKSIGSTIIIATINPRDFDFLNPEKILEL